MALSPVGRFCKRPYWLSLGQTHGHFAGMVILKATFGYDTILFLRPFSGVTRKTEIHPMTEIRRNLPKSAEIHIRSAGILVIL